jgi:hypothetical protein
MGQREGRNKTVHSKVPIRYQTMDKLLTIIVTIALFTSCGLTSKYQDGQHSVYAKMLTTKEREVINQRGELVKSIELNNPQDKVFLKGTLRILKTDKQDFYNFVEIGQWINHSRLGNSGESHLEFKDTTNNDNLGNTTFRVIYYRNKQGEFTLGERWNSKKDKNSAIRHIEIFNNKILTSEYDVKIADFNTPKSDRLKRGVIIGTRKDYSASGKLISTKTFDENGKLIKEEKNER